MGKKKSKTVPYQSQVALFWNEYFGSGQLEDWQRLCLDLGLGGDLSSKKKCRKAMRGVWINIYDFLLAADKTKVKRFPNKAALAQYTIETRRFYPKRKVESGSPLRLLMADIVNPRR